MEIREVYNSMNEVQKDATGYIISKVNGLNIEQNYKNLFNNEFQTMTHDQKFVVLYLIGISLGLIKAPEKKITGLIRRLREVVNVTHHLTIAPFRLGDLKNGDRFCVTPDPYFRAEYIKTNMMHTDSGEWYCCNLVNGRMDIFPLDQVVYTKREVK